MRQAYLAMIDLNVSNIMYKAIRAASNKGWRWAIGDSMTNWQSQRSDGLTRWVAVVTENLESTGVN
ncbi:MAG: hypothetical protein ACI89U_002013 [Gammaproteobacteria bacterium]|jgi:hypothetical protein